MDWDVFIAHASADRKVAESLFALLDPHCRVFLDSKKLKAGDIWDELISSAQQASRATVVLVTNDSHRAHYELAEVASAVALARDPIARHRVIPVLLGEAKLPYGLERVQAIRLQGTHSIAEAATQILEIIETPSAGDEKAAPVFEATHTRVSRHWGFIAGETIEATFRLARHHTITYQWKPGLGWYTIHLVVDGTGVYTQKFSILTEGAADISRLIELGLFWK
jgi:hypothetical protein